MKKRRIFLAIFIILLLGIGVFPIASSAQSDILSNGDQGAGVTDLQEKLHLLGYLDPAPTGYYGSLTEAAVQQLQQDFDLPVDGVLGPQTSYRLIEIEKVARVVHGEARGEPYEGQVAVASVIKNRVYSSEFPSSIEEVIYQKNGFTPVADGQYWLNPGSYAYRAVKDAWRGWDPSDGSTYFYNPHTATSDWIFAHTRSHRQIGGHLFATVAE
ncbi:spore cortex-lytic enzyme [Halobacillus andaensis]|uniref:Spore cortex-lytic enzyme n=1 Tax=Halobacillus andaensis TaxID=1176239 RepID=A0A917B4D4_HALAA|nr:cell wall hydrolase [Halobacillus andaensis]MBP2004293.1 N-acetylmuramoyl-L-alanine amidase [Halobacillus andaensis]GGF22775.1 spore cortex-lytic enzyme [Halobacillus andaensis]